MFMETIKIDKAKAFHLDYHELRINRALQSINASAFFSLKDIIKPPSNTLMRARIIYDKSSYFIEYFDYKARQISSLLAVESDINYEHKYANRDSINALFTCKDKNDDILIVKDSLITDTSIANIAFFSEVRWITPKHPLLQGTTRARLIDEGFLHVEDITLNEALNFKGFALMNAMIGFHQVANGIISIKKG